MHEYMEQEIECEELLECIHGLKSLDTECFLVLNETGEPMTVDDIAEQIDRERSTAYRSVQRLLDHGLVRKEQVNHDEGGYSYVYEPRDPTAVARKMQRMLNEWTADMGGLIDEFRAKYNEQSESAE